MPRFFDRFRPFPASTPSTTLSSLILSTQSANLWSYHKLDEVSGDYLDSSGNNRTLTAGGTGNTYSQPGLVGDCIKFNGAGYGSRAEAIDPSANDWTMWYIAKGTTASGVFVGFNMALGSSTTNTPVVASGQQTANTNTLQGLARDDSNHSSYNASSGVVWDGSWHTIAFFQRSGSTYQAIDGVVTLLAASSLATTTVDTTAIGVLKRTTLVFYSSAYLQHCCIWTTGLSDSELLALHNQAITGI